MLRRILLFGGMSLALLVVMGQGDIRGSHDEPIVIDNGPVVVGRSISDDEDGPVKEGRKDSWKHHEIEDLKDLTVWVKRGTTWTKSTPYSLSGVKKIDLDLVTPQSNTATIWMTMNRHLRLHEPRQAQQPPDIRYSVTPTTDPLDSKKTRYEFRPMHRTYGGDWYVKELRSDKGLKICLHDGMSPHSGTCGTNDPPSEIKVVVCTTITRMCPDLWKPPGTN